MVLLLSHNQSWSSGDLSPRSWTIVIALRAIPIVPTSEVSEDVIVEIGLAFATGTFHHTVSGAYMKTAPGAFVPDDGFSRLYLTDGPFTKWLPNGCQSP